MSATEVDLLAFLHDVVRRDAGAPGLAGSLAFGVQRPDGHTTWWQVTCAERAHGAFVAEPSACDATLYLGERDARAIVQTGHLPSQPELVRASGERALLSRFVRRYVRGNSAVGVRQRSL